MTNDARKDPGQAADERRLLDHEYDGIQEYDNPLPGWWTAILWATILYSVLYWMNLPGIGTGKGRIANYERDMATAHAQQAALVARTPPPADLTAGALLALTRDAARLRAGKERFVSTCAACHRPDGGGSIGPNLTDDYWIHGGRPLEIMKVVTDGVPDKGMPTWSQTLRPAEIAEVVAYLITLHDTHPPNPKEPQGVKVESGGE